MIFIPSIDITKYCDEYGNYTADGAIHLQEDTDREFGLFNSHRNEDENEHKMIRNQIDALLAMGNIEAFDEICKIVTDSNFDKLSYLFSDFKTFKTSCIIYKIERESGFTETVYDKIGNIDDYVRYCTKMLHLFRRIQLLCPYKDIVDLFMQFIETGLSFFFVVQMLKELEIGDKYQVGIKLADLYNVSGCITEAEIIRSYVIKNFEYKENVESKVEEVLETHIAEYETDYNKKICFVSCVNDDFIYSECLYYIKRLIVPDGCSIDTLAVYDAKSATSGYNEAMAETDADILIYIHQDVRILNPYFLFDIINIFASNPEIGMMGVVGSPKLPPDAVMWHGIRYGKLYELHQDGISFPENRMNKTPKVRDVVAIDGLLMATNKRVRWREDVFDGWDFYDISQSTEYIKNGYRIVVPEQEVPWTAHDAGIMNLYSYDIYRKKYLAEYSNG
ncbi:glycosyltransferase family protein [Butyrivibrio sp. YAB3001]|uniref:glycosyltransferase family protein n=1 Tax=Butyrivibrio sp. YAB3001 TaxID=1520812 RepID=UPI0008F66389|nr:glycosyltransferase family protein [Butyrivibrio sp. YAB3001]SFB94783.1 Glycosyltransferase like family protein [Butyrivibrio sp. YAB3001]